VRWLIEKLFGLEAELGPGGTARPTLVGLWDWAWLLVPVVVFAAWFVLSMYRTDARRLEPKQKRALLLLRLVAVLIVLLMLQKPAFAILKGEDRLPLVVCLVDESASMAYPGSRDNVLIKGAALREERTRMAAARKATVKILESGLARTHRVKIYAFSDIVRPLKDLAWRGKREWEEDARALERLLASPTGGHTDIGDAIQRTLGDFSGKQQLSALVVLSDGRRTGGASYEEAAELARADEVEVETVSLGTAEPLRDLAIANLIAPPEANLNDVLAMRVVVVNHIRPQLRVKLKLYEQNSENREASPSPLGVLVGEGEYVLPEGRKDIVITTVPKVEGEVRYTVVLPEFPDELTHENNRAEAFVNVVKRSLRVLYIAGSPTPEYHFMLPCLVRDPVINVSCWLDSADVDYLHQGNTRIERPPRSFEEWMEYDVVILYDIDPEKFTNEQENGLEHLVRAGGGLLFIAGRVHGLDALLSVRTAKMKEILPVEIDKSRHPNYRRVFDKPFRTARTEAGARHPVFLFEMSPKENEKVWASFPQFYWHHPVVRAKLDSVELLKRKGAADDRGDVLMALARYGEGVVFYTGLDTMWRWRYPMENYDYDRFWTQTIRYLGETRLLGTQKQVVLDTNKKKYSPGETAQIMLSVLDPALLKQLRSEHLFVTITDESGAPFQTRLDPPRGKAADYTARYKVRRVGRYQVCAAHTLREGSSDQKLLFDEKKHFTVDLESLEKVDTTSDLEGMGRLASATGGHAYTHHNMDTLEELAAKIPKKRQRFSLQADEDIWDSPFFLLFFLVLVSAEWVLRRRWNLL